jgi:hypothetical protein
MPPKPQQHGIMIANSFLLGSILMKKLVNNIGKGGGFWHGHVSYCDELPWLSTSPLLVSDAMLAEVNRAIPSLHLRHKKQRLVLFSAFFSWPHR